MEERTEGKTSISTKSIIRLLSIVCITMFFCPMFMVSCSGQTVEISAVKLLTGVKVYGETAVKPNPIFLLCLALPLIILGAMFMKKESAKTAAVISLCCALGDIAFWFMFRYKVEETARENYCEFRTTGWFIVNIVALLLISILALLEILNVLKLEPDSAENHAVGSAGIMRAPLPTRSGQPGLSPPDRSVRKEDPWQPVSNPRQMNTPQEIQSQPSTRQVSPRSSVRFCPMCGNKLGENHAFCGKCGTKIKR